MHERKIGIMCGVEVFDHADSVDAFRFLSVRGKVMYQKQMFCLKMIREIIKTSSLKKDTERLHEIIAQVKVKGTVQSGKCR